MTWPTLNRGSSIFCCCPRPEYQGPQLEPPDTPITLAFALGLSLALLGVL